jgi:putative hydrolase of HD superfamily
MVPLLLELQRLKRLERTGWSLRGMPYGTESVAAHSFGVAITSMLLADELANHGIQLAVDRLLRMALLHDLAEARVGDMPRTATPYFGVSARKAAETAAFTDMVQSTNAGRVYQHLHEEYEERETLEARVVKAADVIDLLVHVLALERAGARGLDEFWDVARAPNFQLDGPAKELVTNILRSLLDERTK